MRPGFSPAFHRGISLRARVFLLSDTCHLNSSPNPFFERTHTTRRYAGFLSSAGTLIVSADSANMLSEAASTGAPVFLLGADAATGKARALVEALEARGAARRVPEAEAAGEHGAAFDVRCRQRVILTAPLRRMHQASGLCFRAVPCSPRLLLSYATRRLILRAAFGAEVGV